MLAEPRGFCSGVERAIRIVERALETHAEPVYVRKQIVHNQHVVDSLEARGARFVDSTDDIPDGAVCVISAHGASPMVRDGVRARGLTMIDATCPLVAKVHQEARRFAAEGRHILLIGHAGHDEVEGTLGEAPERTTLVETVEDVARLDVPGASIAYLTQTTLSFDDTAEIIEAVRARYPEARGPVGDDICYASQNRQVGVKSLAARCEVVLVVGAENSSNSMRMVEVARAAGADAHLVPDPASFDPAVLAGATVVGVSAGASAPESLVEDLVRRLAGLGFGDVQIDRTSVEDVHFALPRSPGGQARR
ncbi:4-hydroxy-3-methylbut-2-enyl diphosphate reductase [Pseudonocardia spinosispora]|uniref:4-hydroxy-3-methylbut-2-enyl diphosphate reductase n=1 Tax=Pseudonocardia spinosispora TaxID=103441 RepID=UPI00048E0224|nr:4-hydroxy-3-methylbut-2-enyl diphosphate reductase [Pseudonocardia spinosispora]